MENMLLPYYNKDVIEAGLDEAGRGCLAGPVFAAAVILPPDFSDPLLNDSKKLNHKQRDKLRKIIENEAISFAVSNCTPAEIDEINILNASFKSMHRAIDMLNVTPESLLVDGNRFIPYQFIPHTCIIKGDGKYNSIAAASILAKTYRDEYMYQIHYEYPQYGWDRNKGYPTEVHRQACFKTGLSPHHRLTFRWDKACSRKK